MPWPELDTAWAPFISPQSTRQPLPKFFMQMQSWYWFHFTSELHTNGSCNICNKPDLCMAAFCTSFSSSSNTTSPERLSLTNRSRLAGPSNTLANFHCHRSCCIFFVAWIKWDSTCKAPRIMSDTGSSLNVYITVINIIVLFSCITILNDLEHLFVF